VASPPSPVASPPSPVNGDVLLDGIVGWSNGMVAWSDPPAGWEICGKVTTVFGAAICVSQQAWSTSQAKCNHVANVYYQLLDNDANGSPDDVEVLSELLYNRDLLWVPANEADSEIDEGFIDRERVGQVQMSHIEEAVINSCDTPTNRGASATNRDTWAGAIDTDGLTCSNERDATFEEILHLITVAASRLHPNLWGATFSSAAGAALSLANGNCGWGFMGNWIDPGSNNCDGQFAYEDETCDEGCNVVEGIYWASASFVGGLYTKGRADSIGSEWLMATPDDGMPILPNGKKNARSLQSGSPALYALVSDTTSMGHEWLPAIMTDGAYKGNPVPVEYGNKL